MKRTLLSLAVLALSTVLLAACGSGHAASSIGPAVALTESDLPGFTSQFEPETRPCGVGVGVIPPGPPWYSACIDETGSWFVVNDALSGEGRAQLDAYKAVIAASVNEPNPNPTWFPGETFMGPFVTSHHGVFAVQQTTRVFANENAARQWLQYWNDAANDSPQPGAPGWMTLDSPSLGDGSISSRSDDVDGSGPDTESQIVTRWRKGRLPVELVTRGARDMTPDDNYRLAAVIESRLEAELARIPREVPTNTPMPAVEATPQRSNTGYLVRLPSGTAPDSPHIKAPFLAEPNAAFEALGLNDYYVADSDLPEDLPPGAEAYPLYLQAASPDLYTDYFRLDGPPAAKALHDAAYAYLLNNAIVPQDKLRHAATQWYLSDDNLPDGMIAVYTLLQTPAPSPTEHSGRTVVMTVFLPDRQTIVSAARVNVYAAEPD